MPEKIAIVGAGALGAHAGGYMTKAGYDVTLIDPWPEHVETMRTKGLILEGQTPAECFTVPVKAIHLTELQEVAKGRPFDIAFVAMKSYDTVWATQMIAQYLTADGFVVSLQNSINEERIASVVGWGKTVGCIASMIAVALDRPGHVRRQVGLGGKEHTVFRVGEPHGRITKRIERIAEMVGAADSAKTTNNLWGERWSKLCINAMRNPVSAATGRGGNANDRDPVTRKLAIRLAGEAVKTGLAHGYVLEKIYKMDPMQVMAASDGDAAALAACEDILLANVKMRNDDQRPSMGQDIQKGRRTEIDYINGLVAAKARELGIGTPANDGIVAAVKRVERGEVEPAPEVVAGI
jgi:2-dehydropantoate 2-reductase